ncbi:MAG: sulfotransferase [Halioglobus sp.]
MPAAASRSSLAVVIVGAPRSGTYWVVDLLQTRLGVHIPTETHFFPLFQRYLWFWGDLSIAGNRRRLLKNIYEFIESWTARSSVSDEYRAGVRRVSLLVTLDEGRADRIVAESDDYPSLVEALYRHFADIQGVQLSGDKSAHHRVITPEDLFEPFPDTKMLHVVRDGRDVAVSWLKEWFGPGSVREAAKKWAEHVEVNREWGRRNPDRYLELRYEDLAEDLEEGIRRLSSFMGIPAGEYAAGSSALAEVLSTSPSHAGMKKIVAADNVAKWRSAMSPQDVAVFERMAGQTLLSSGYELAEPVQSAPSFALPRPSAHSLRVGAKTMLPLVLGVGDRLGLPVLKFVNRKYPSQWREVAW